jgi:hypothetical protein
MTAHSRSAALLVPPSRHDRLRFWALALSAAVVLAGLFTLVIAASEPQAALSPLSPTAAPPDTSEQQPNWIQARLPALCPQSAIPSAPMAGAAGRVI